ncbi:pyridoxal-phosphate dependent enzyme [Microlunatus sp. GCM10028923]|uniref:pyridoxal-phosphate dependent enzyme n=1 Tax=Microlunatus sp. GCM10028923 TaxID=3273400 RepID=UPI003614FF22
MINGGMWRWADRLPVRRPDQAVSLGEGDTPLVDLSRTVAARIGLDRLWLKAEDRNPTGSFKARVASVAYTLIKERGLAGAVGTSSGNGGAAAAAYAAAAGSRAILFTLADIVAPKLREIVAVGGVARRVTGIGHDAAATRQIADRIAEVSDRLGCYPLLTGFHYAAEAMTGVQTIAYELAEQLPEPAVVYAPVGGGGLLTGLHRGFAELGAVPRLVGVQPSGGASLRRALAGHPEGLDHPVTTAVSGLQMAVLYDAAGAVAAVRDSGGHDVITDDAEILAAQAILADAGLLVEPAGATALAGVIADLAAGRLDRAEPVVVIATGAGHKDTAALDRLASAATVPVITPDRIGDELASLINDGGGRP